MGQEVRRSRKRAGLTQAALARRVGISQQHLSLIESAPEGVQLRTIARVLSALGLTLAVLPTAADALRRRQDAWKRMNAADEAAPTVYDPTAALARAGELADLYRRLHGPQAGMPDAPTLASWREVRRRLSLLGAR